MKTFNLTEETLNKVLAYLDTRPHGEVRGVVDAILTETTAQIKAAQLKAVKETSNGASETLAN